MTTARVEYSSVLSMPLNTSLKSAAYPSGPVTWEASPSALDWVIVRTESAVAAARFQPSLPRLTETTVCMALPSAEGTGPTTWPGPTPCSPAKLRASAAALARSAAVSPEARSYTTTAGKIFGDWKRDWMSRTLVDSALAGSHVFASFFSAPVSFDDSGRVTTSTTTQKPTTTHLVQLPAGISAILLSLLTDSTPRDPPAAASLPGPRPATAEKLSHAREAGAAARPRRLPERSSSAPRRSHRNSAGPVRQ